MAMMSMEIGKIVRLPSMAWLDQKIYGNIMSVFSGFL